MPGYEAKNVTTSGGCSASIVGSYAVTSNLSMSGCTVTVTFGKIIPKILGGESWKVRVGTDGSGSGSATLVGSGITGSCGTGCYNVVDRGTVTVTQTPASGSAFTGLAVGCTGWNIPVDSDMNCTVTFTKKSINVWAQPQKVLSGKESHIFWASTGYSFCTPPKQYSTDTGTTGDFWAYDLTKDTTFTVECK